MKNSGPQEMSSNLKYLFLKIWGAQEKFHFMGGKSLGSDSSPSTLPGEILLPLDYSPLLPDGGVDLIPQVENYSPNNSIIPGVENYT